MLLAANELAPEIGSETDDFGVKNSAVITLHGSMLKTGFDRNVGSGDGYLFVGFLTLLVKKKERRGRRVFAVDGRV